MNRFLAPFEAGRFGAWLTSQVGRLVRRLRRGAPKPASFRSLVEKMQARGGADRP